MIYDTLSTTSSPAVSGTGDSIVTMSCTRDAGRSGELTSLVVKPILLPEQRPCRDDRGVRVRSVPVRFHAVWRTFAVTRHSSLGLLPAEEVAPVDLGLGH